MGREEGGFSRKREQSIMGRLLKLKGAENVEFSRTSCVTGTLDLKQTLRKYLFHTSMWFEKSPNTHCICVELVSG